MYRVQGSVIYPHILDYWVIDPIRVQASVILTQYLYYDPYYAKAKYLILGPKPLNPKP